MTWHRHINDEQNNYYPPWIEDCCRYIVMKSKSIVDYSLIINTTAYWKCVTNYLLRREMWRNVTLFIKVFIGVHNENRGHLLRNGGLPICPTIDINLKTILFSLFFLSLVFAALNLLIESIGNPEVFVRADHQCGASLVFFQGILYIFF